MSRLEQRDIPRPDVSVVVPCHNVAKTVRQTIGSILDQTHEGWEAICIDDASTDETPSVLSEIAERDARIRVARFPHGGLAAARNRGIGLAQADRVFFLDADDVLRPRALACLLATAEQSSPRTIVTGGYELLDEAGRPLSIYHFPTVPQFTLETLLLSNRIPPMTLVPRSLLGERPFDDTLPTCSEDWDLWLRLAHGGVQCVTVPGVLFGYRLHSASMSHRADTLYRSAMAVLDRWIPEAEDASAVRDVRHRMAVHCGAIALASGETGALQRYWTALQPVALSEAFSLAAASSIHKAYQFVHGARAETWRSHCDSWLREIEPWLAVGVLAKYAGPIMAELRRILAEPSERAVQVRAMLLDRSPAPAIVIYGLGTNGLSLIEHLRSDDATSTWDLRVADDYAGPLVFDTIDLPREDIATWQSWPQDTIVVVTPNDPDAMCKRLIDAGGREGSDFFALTRMPILRPVSC